MKIAQKSTFFIVLTSLVVVVSFVLTLIFGLKLGIDFTGGSLIEVTFEDGRPANSEVEEVLIAASVDVSQIKEAGEKDAIIRTKDLSEEKHQEVLMVFKENFGNVTENRFESIGPTLGNELKNKAFVAIGLVLLAIVLYLSYAFRKISKEVASWKFGIAAIVALVHDIAIIVGVFVLLGKFAGVEIDALFVTALLTVLGFSVHDTIVVFDRVRYNLLKKEAAITFDQVVNNSVLETVVRSINTSSTTLFVLVSLFLFGGESIQWFVLALAVGVIAGTYSSIFVASPVLVFWHRYSQK